MEINVIKTYSIIVFLVCILLFFNIFYFVVAKIYGGILRKIQKNSNFKITKKNLFLYVLILCSL